MKKISLSLFYTAGFLVLIHIGLGLALRQFPPSQPLHNIDTGGNIGHVLAVSQPRQAVFGAPALAHTNEPKIIVMGASNAREGFRPEDWQNVWPEFDFHNTAVGSATPRTLSTLWHHYANELSAQTARRSTVILSVVYGMFTSKWEDVIRKEEARLAPIYRSGADVWIDKRFLNFIKEQSYRYFAVDLFYHEILSPISQFVTTVVQKDLGKLSPGAHSNDLPTTPLSTRPVNRESALEMWEKAMSGTGTIDPVQFKTLQSLITDIRRTGVKLIVVNMPVPSWHRERSRYDGPFCEALRSLVTAMLAADPGISFVDIHDRASDDDFRDSLHPTRAGAKRWSNWVIEAINDDLKIKRGGN